MMLIIISKNLHVYEVGVQMLRQIQNPETKDPLTITKEVGSIPFTILYVSQHYYFNINKPCFGIYWKAARSLKDPHFAEPTPD